MLELSAPTAITPCTRMVELRHCTAARPDDGVESHRSELLVGAVHSSAEASGPTFDSVVSSCERSRLRAIRRHFGDVHGVSDCAAHVGATFSLAAASDSGLNSGMVSSGVAPDGTNGAAAGQLSRAQAPGRMGIDSVALGRVLCGAAPSGQRRRCGLVIGQSPPLPIGALPPGYQPFQGQPEKRLARLAGLASPEELWTAFDRLDLVGWCPPPKPRRKNHQPSIGYNKHNWDGHQFPFRDARIIAGRLLRMGGLARKYAMVVLCGKKVAVSFGLHVMGRPLPWAETFEGVRFLVLPHTSGVSHYWNDEASWHRAACFFRAALKAVRLLQPSDGGSAPTADACWAVARADASLEAPSASIQDALLETPPQSSDEVPLDFPDAQVAKVPLDRTPRAPSPEASLLKAPLLEAAFFRVAPSNKARALFALPPQALQPQVHSKFFASCAGRATRPERGGGHARSSPAKRERTTSTTRTGNCGVAPEAKCGRARKVPNWPDAGESTPRHGLPCKKQAAAVDD